MRHFKRKKGYYVCAVHLDDPVYCSFGFKTYGYYWRGVEFKNTRQIESYSKQHKEK